MEGTPLAERQRRIISRVARVDDPTLLEAIERVLDEDGAHPRLMPLEEADVDRLVRLLLGSEG